MSAPSILILIGCALILFALYWEITHRGVGILIRDAQFLAVILLWAGVAVIAGVIVGVGL